MDFPIESRGQDTLERYIYAKEVSKHLVEVKESKGLIYSIEGSWGSGKTSFINLMKENLVSFNNNPIIIDYNPWLIKNLDSLIEGFFVELASALSIEYPNEKGRKIAKEVVNFAKFLEPIKLFPGVEPWGSLVQKTIKSSESFLSEKGDFSGLSLINKKEHINDLIENLEKRVVVFIDDIDRLDPYEVREIMKLVKAVADFKNTSYVLSYEREAVVNALTYENQYDGADYLEKIVQFWMPLPRMSAIHRKRYVDDTIENTFEEDDLQHVEEEFFEECKILIARTLDTPRKIKRLAVNSYLPIKNLRGEVCPVDILLIRLLEEHYPEVYSWIYNSIGYFTGEELADDFHSGLDYVDMDLEVSETLKEKGKEEEIREKVAGFGYGQYETRNILKILHLIFPNILGHYNYDNVLSPDRIFYLENLHKIFHMGVRENLYSNIDGKKFLCRPEERKEILDQLTNSGEIQGWFNFLRRFLDDYPVQDFEQLIDLLCDVYNYFHKEFGSFSTSEIDGFAFDSINTIKSRESKYITMNYLLSNPDCLALGEEVLVKYLKKYGVVTQEKVDFSVGTDENAKREYLFEIEDLSSLSNTWLTKVEKRIQNPEDLIAIPDISFIIMGWGRLKEDGFEEPKRRINYLIDSPEGMENFLSIIYNLECSSIEHLLEEPEKVVRYIQGKKEANIKEHEVKILECVKSIKENKSSNFYKNSV